MIDSIATRLLTIAALAAMSSPMVLAEGGAAAAANYQVIPFTLPQAASRIEALDVNGDGLLDLLTNHENNFNLYLQGDKGFDFAKPDASLELKGKAIGWALDSNGDSHRLLALVDSRQVQAWNISKGKFSEPSTILSVHSAILPAGAYPLDFVRDINGDGLSDLIIPGAGYLQIYLQAAEGGYGEPLSIQARIMNDVRLDAGPRLDRQVGQRLRIPDLQIRDLNGDGRPDLISASAERIDVFLADAAGRFPAGPSWSVDLRQLEERVGEINFDQVDYSNLSGLLAHTYDVQLDDVDGDGIDDLLIREGGKLTLYGGSREGMDLSQPRQVLRSSGNVLGTLLRDEDEDGLQDLWLMRVQNVSLANLFLWLAISGSVDIETFVYRNEGKRFASRPHRKLILTVKFPSILRSVDLLTAAMEPAEGGNVVRAVRARLGDADSSGDLAVLGTQSLAIFMNKARDQQSEHFLGLSDYSRSKNNYVYDLAKLLENPARSDAGLIPGAEPDFEIPLPEQFTEDLELRNMDVVARELNGDGRDDFFVLLERNGAAVRGLLLLSR